MTSTTFTVTRVVGTHFITIHAEDTVFKSDFLLVNKTLVTRNRGELVQESNLCDNGDKTFSITLNNGPIHKKYSITLFDIKETLKH